jgi:hypothetical protein
MADCRHCRRGGGILHKGWWRRSQHFGNRRRSTETTTSTSTTSTTSTASSGHPSRGRGVGTAKAGLRNPTEDMVHRRRGGDRRVDFGLGHCDGIHLQQQQPQQ